MSSVEDLVFAKEYEEACAASDLGDARMNYMIRRYNAALKYWSARGRYAEIELGKERSKHSEWKAYYERKSVEFKQTSETAILEKNRAIARITADRKRIEDLQLKLEGAQVVPGMEADAPSELESAWAEVAELKRQIFMKDREISRLQKAWSRDFVLECVRIQKAMTEKCNCRFQTIRDWNVCQKANDDKLLLHAQALEMRKCLEKIRGKRGVLRDPTDGGASPGGGSRIAMPGEQGTACTTRPDEVEGKIRQSGDGDAPDPAGRNVTNTREDDFISDMLVLMNKVYRSHRPLAPLSTRSIDDMRLGVAGRTRLRGLMAEVLARQWFPTRPKVVPRGLRLARPYPRTIRGSGSSFR
ncbi:hypothetical protein HID58_069796 [Brassica napus]|uniref:Uncharacterized protein n=1 Tax=Brassica napus TaxID=3708 RepID=A0ABQ7YWX3_BRANA|nr:hypothetical protein HID58_069796 [Brassica napus]